MASGLEPICAGGVKAFGSVFTQLNNRGAHARLVDPTVDIKAARDALRNRSRMETLWGALLDRPPEGHEHLLSGVGKGLSRRQTADFLRDLEAEHGGVATYLLLDRSPCLAHSPIQLRTIRLVSFRIKVLRAPCPLQVVSCDGPPANMALSQEAAVRLQKGLTKVRCHLHSLPMNQSMLVDTAAWHVEVGINCPVAQDCASAAED